MGTGTGTASLGVGLCIYVAPVYSARLCHRGDSCFLHDYSPFNKVAIVAMIDTVVMVASATLMMLSPCYTFIIGAGSFEC